MEHFVKGYMSPPSEPKILVARAGDYEAGDGVNIYLDMHSFIIRQRVYERESQIILPVDSFLEALGKLQSKGGS